MRRAFLPAAIAILVLTVSASAALSGSWSSTIGFRPAADPAITLRRSTLTFRYATPTTLWSSTSLFDDSTFRHQEFSFMGTVDVFDLASKLSLAPAALRTDYWLLEVDTSIAGLHLTGTMLVEYVSAEEAHGLGLRLTAATQLPEGAWLEATTLLGIEENLAEMLGWVRGSGYDIVDRYDLMSLAYTSTTVELTNMTLGWCPLCEGATLDTIFVFNKERGFDSITFTLTVQPNVWPLSVELSTRFTTDSKTVTLVPELVLGPNCVTLFLEFSPPWLEMGQSTITGVTLKGVGLSCELGPVFFSTRRAVVGTLWKDRGAPVHIRLRAHQYHAEPPPWLLLYYEETIYTSVMSLVWNKEPRFAIDFYFEGPGPLRLFGLALITAEARFSPFENLRLGLGMSAVSDGTLEFLFDGTLTF